MELFDSIDDHTKIFSSTKDEYDQVIETHYDSIFHNNHRLEIKTGDRFSEANSNQNRYRLRLLILQHEHLAGFHLGYEETPGVYYMQTTAVLPQFRLQGIYKQTLQRLIQNLWNLGFHKINSRHYMTQNNIIVPKLKAGFFIQGFESDPRFGHLIKLSLYRFSETENQARMRSGEIKPLV